jgi:lipopolysaccharide heptosyltransferase II
MRSTKSADALGSLAAWFRTALTLCGKAFARVFRRPNTATTKIHRTMVVYGAFKGMGDLLCAAPTIASELELGSNVVLLLFPQLVSFANPINFGPQSARLKIACLPIPLNRRTLHSFFRTISSLRPELIWYSPHAPITVSSWRIPLLLAITKTRYWPTATLAGATSERLSWLFDVRLPIDRKLPYMLREWTGYTQLDPTPLTRKLAQIRFVDRIHDALREPRQYDILIHPGASAENRKWPREYYPELVKHIPSHYRLAVLGLSEDVDEIKALLPRNRGIQFISGSLEAAITTIARARVAVTMDSGPMFFAKALGVPTISLFGPSDPKTVVESGADIRDIYVREWPCQPCGNTRCNQSVLRCMQSVTPETVARVIVRRLRQVAND